jgi:hypothetical protein
MKRILIASVDKLWAAPKEPMILMTEISLYDALLNMFLRGMSLSKKTPKT